MQNSGGNPVMPARDENQEALVGCRDPTSQTKVVNSSISAFVCASSPNAIRSSEQQREDGSEKLAHEIERGFCLMLRAGPRSAASSARGP